MRVSQAKRAPQQAGTPPQPAVTPALSSTATQSAHAYSRGPLRSQHHESSAAGLIPPSPARRPPPPPAVKEAVVAGAGQMSLQRAAHWVPQTVLLTGENRSGDEVTRRRAPDTSMSLNDAMRRPVTEAEVLLNPAATAAEGLVHSFLSNFSRRLGAADRAYALAERARERVFGPDGREGLLDE